MATTSSTPVAPARSRHIPGEAGLWVLLFGDMTVFAVLFAVFLTHRGEQPAVFAASQGTLDRGFGAFNTLLLLTSSLLVVLATREVRGPSPERAPRLLTGAMACGAGFIVVKGFEYHAVFAGSVTPATNSFYTYYLVLTGLHLAHLCVGLVVLGVLTALSRSGPVTEGRFLLFEGGACFWHMVDLLWIVIFPLLYLVR